MKLQQWETIFLIIELRGQYWLFIIAGSWRNVQPRTLINCLVSCPDGVYFHTSVDATDVVDATSLFVLLDEVLEEMGEEMWCR